MDSFSNRWSNAFCGQDAGLDAADITNSKQERLVPAPWYFSMGDNKLLNYSAGWARKAFCRVGQSSWAHKPPGNSTRRWETASAQNVELFWKLKDTEKSLSWNNINNRHLSKRTGTCQTAVGQENFFYLPFQVLWLG